MTTKLSQHSDIIKRQYYRLHDIDCDTFPVKIELDEAEYWNNRQYGIFRTINEFDGPRTKNNPNRKLKSFAVEIDDISKQEQFELMKKINIKPSEVIESRRGFQIYWDIEGEVTDEEYEDVLANYLIPAFKADKKCKDIARLFRQEGFYNWRDGIDKPFYVKKLYSSHAKYTAKEMKRMLVKSVDRQPVKVKRQYSVSCSANSIYEALGGVRVGSSSYKVHCPVGSNHKNGDKHPSLSVTDSDGRALIYCHAGCTFKELACELESLGLWTSKME